MKGEREQISDEEMKAIDAAAQELARIIVSFLEENCNKMVKKVDGN